MFENFLTMEFPRETQRWMIFAFFWSGFSIWVGLFARVLLPSRDFRSPWATFLLGWIGVALGPLVVKTLAAPIAFHPISPAGMASALVFSVLATVIYYVFSFLFPNREDDEEEEEFKKQDELQEYEELQEKYKGITEAELLRFYDDAQRRQERLRNR